MTPSALNFPAAFHEFRPAQAEAIEHIAASGYRFIGIGAPTGMGKSGIGVAAGRMCGGRAVILTANLGLMDQYETEFAEAGMTAVRGRSNYRCIEGGNCEDGAFGTCGARDNCTAALALKAFNEADLALTNYAFWLASPKVKTPDLLICDEAGLAMEWLSRSLDFKITDRDLREVGIKHLHAGEAVTDWSALASRVHGAAEQRYECLREQYRTATSVQRARMARDVRKAQLFMERAAKLSMLDPGWVITCNEESEDGIEWKFECVWPRRFRERLFQHTPRVLLLSATLRPKTMELLGIGKDECDFREWGRQFPLSNGPVIWYPAAQVTHRMTQESREIWLNAIADIVWMYSDRNGLIQTVSYARAKEIADYLKRLHWNREILLNGNADPDCARASDVYRRFLSAKPGALLISPSFSTGWDFKGKAAEFAIITKIAMPDKRPKVIAARCEQDFGYPFYLAAQDVVQGAGRIVRTETDLGTTYIIDNMWARLSRTGSDYIPRWFRVRREDKLPPVLRKIA